MLPPPPLLPPHPARDPAHTAITAPRAKVDQPEINDRKVVRRYINAYNPFASRPDTSASSPGHKQSAERGRTIMGRKPSMVHQRLSLCVPKKFTVRLKSGRDRACENQPPVDPVGNAQRSYQAYFLKNNPDPNSSRISQSRRAGMPRTEIGRRASFCLSLGDFVPWWSALPIA